MKTKLNREDWLQRAVGLMRPLLKSQGQEFPEKWHVSVGFPRGSAKAIGQAWKPQEEFAHMFISPSLKEPVRVLDVLLHEMIHVAVGVEHGHKGPFRKIARALGLEGKLTATYAKEGTELHASLNKIFERLGAYPHTALNPVLNRKRTGGGGWVRYVSTQDDDFKVLVSPRMVREHGAPKDPWGNDMEPVES